MTKKLFFIISCGVLVIFVVLGCEKQIPLSDKTAEWKTYKATWKPETPCSMKYPDTWKLGDKNAVSPQDSYLTPKVKRLPEDIWVEISCLPVTDGYIDPEGGADLLPKCQKRTFTESDGEAFEAIRAREYCILRDDGLSFGIAKIMIRYGRQQMDYYIPEQEYQEEFDTFQKMLGTFRFGKPIKQ